ncbi:MAG: BrnA antitoxin family protein [Candidatus Devosia symbiotica]|nr:BrnA antitoxin family protein [Candidatus Devosia symbiotica]
MKPQESTFVHLKIDPEVFVWFKNQDKGHITRMQDVLKAYVKPIRATNQILLRGHRSPNLHGDRHA